MASYNIRNILFSLTLGASTAAAAGCVSDDNGYVGDDLCVGDCEVGPPISGNAIVDCWVAPAGSPGADPRLDVLECRFEPPTNYPATLDGASIHGVSNSGGEFTGEILPAQAGQVIRMAAIDPSAYPIDLSMDILFDGNDRSVPALAGLEQVRTSVTVNNAEQIASDRPASAQIPFDLWDVNLLGRDTDFSGLSFGYTVDVGADRVHNVAFKTRPLLFGRSEHFYLPVNVDTFALDASLVFASGASDSVSFTGPGDYAIRAGALNRAVASDFPQEDMSGSKIASCWFTTNSVGNEDMYCNARENRGFDLDGAVIVVDTANGKTDRAPVGTDAAFVATISPAAFPMKVSMQARIQSGVIGLEAIGGQPMETSMIVASAKDLPREATRQTLLAPFEVWQATVDNQTEAFEGTLNEYVLELGNGMRDRFATDVTNADLPFVDARSKRSFLVATPAGQFEMKGFGSMIVGGNSQDVDFVLRPGVLVVGE